MANQPANWTTDSPLLVKNKLGVICIIFTAVTLGASALGFVMDGLNSTSDDLHIWARFAIVFIAIGSLYIFDLLQSWPLRVVHAIHYVVTMTIILVALWVMGFFVELHPDAFVDIIVNYTGIYILLVLLEFGYFRWRGRKRVLRKPAD